MNESWMWMALTAGELLLVVLLLLLVSWLRNLATRRRDRKAIKSLVTETKKLKDQRREQIAAFLAGRFGLSGEVLARAVRGVYRAELQLIQTFANIYLHRDAAAAAGFRHYVEEGVEPYWELTPGKASAASESSEMPEEQEDVPVSMGVMADVEEADEDPELARLRGENVRLSEELRVTMDTMSRMLNEYSTIFSKDSNLSDITVLDEEGEIFKDDLATKVTMDTDIQAEDQPVQGVGGEATADREADPVLMRPSDWVGPDEGGDQFSVAAQATLDAAMKDLSLDDELLEEGPQQELPDEARQRIIDADS